MSMFPDPSWDILEQWLEADPSGPTAEPELKPGTFRILGGEERTENIMPGMNWVVERRCGQCGATTLCQGTSAVPKVNPVCHGCESQIKGGPLHPHIPKGPRSPRWMK